jgi:hypothetical protein
MTPKAFTSEARTAIEAESGPLFDAIVNAYIAANIRDTEDADAGESDPYAHVARLLKNFANPKIVHLVYAFYSTRLPTHVSLGGQRVRILEPKTQLEDRANAIGSFNLLFGGKKGWFEHAIKYKSLGYDRKRLERLAVRWLEGDWDNAEFFKECKQVPGFDQQLAAVTVSDDGQWASDEHMLHSAGYKQLKEQYVREGGEPEDMDELARAFLSGDQVRVKQLQQFVWRKRFPRRQSESKARHGCLGATLLVFVIFVVTVTVVFSL